MNDLARKLSFWPAKVNRQETVYLNTSPGRPKGRRPEAQNQIAYAIFKIFLILKHYLAYSAGAYSAANTTHLHS